MSGDGSQKRQWLSRTFAPFILVGGSETAKREVAFLTGLSLACLFQPFNGEVGHRVQARIKHRENGRARGPSETSNDSPVSGSLSDDEEDFSPDQLDHMSGGHHGVSKLPPLSLQLRVECAHTSGSGSTKSSTGGGGSVKRLSRSFCVRFMNLEEAEPISCLSVESLAARSLLLASPSVSELRERMHSGPSPSGAGYVVPGAPPSSTKEGPLGVELPWYNEWRRVIFEGSRFSPHETLSQPVGLILIVSTRDPDPVAALEELLQPSNLPQMCRQYILDPNPVRAVILLDAHADAYAARMHAGASQELQQQGTPLRADAGEGAVERASNAAGDGGEIPPATEVGSPERASSRAKEVMERLCAVFPPANCHLLTLGRGCTDTRHQQVRPAIRYLYSQSLSFCFHQSLSANLTPTLLSHPLPPHAHPPAIQAEDVSLQLQQEHQPQQQQQQQQQAETIVWSTEKLPVASRLTATTSTAGTSAKGIPAQHQHQQQHGDPSSKSFAPACLGCSFCVGLGWQDLQWLGAFVRHFVATSVAPWAEQRIRQLDSSISSNRKGFRNQLRYLWRKPKVPTAAATPSAAADAVAGLAAAAEEAGGAAEALLSAVGGALLGDSGRASSASTTNGAPCDVGEGKPSGGATPASPSSTASAGYVLHAIEWQYRLLGDLSLFFGQTENALQSYRSCAADFKQDKRWVHLGGAYEMCGVALHATGGPRREVESYIEQAYNAYVKAAAGRLALRCVLLGHRLLMDGSNSNSSSSSSFLQLPHVLHLPLMIGGGNRASDVSAEVARRLIAANAELPSLDASMWQQQQQQQQQQGISAIQAQSQAIRSAMLLEQAAVCLEQAGPSHWRKRNFQLVMAGHTYYKAGYKRFALRCYLHVFEGYEAGGWHHVAQHLRFIMARQTFSLHLLEESVLHFLGLLNGIATLHECRVLARSGGAGLPLIPPERQSHYVREFLFVCRVLLERQRLAAQGGGTAPAKALPAGPSASLGSSRQRESETAVALNAELRVPILQLRDSLGLFRDSVGVYLVGDALPPEEESCPLPAELSLLALRGARRNPALNGGPSSFSLPSYEALARFISREASVQSLQELTVQERLWDRLFALHLQRLGAAGSAGLEAETGQGARFVSYPVYESLRRKTAVGLPVTVELRIMNPLDLRIDISNLRLFGTLLPTSAAEDKATVGGIQTPLASESSGHIVFSTASVELEPTASATIRLTATPLSPGRLCLQGVVGELFKLVQVSQYFCLHGAQRAERSFDMRHCHLDVEPEDEVQDGDIGAPEGGPYLLQQRLSMIRQMLAAPQTSEVKAQLSRLLRGLPLLYALHAEGFRLLHTGTPIQVCRWDSRRRMAETHKPDLRLEMDVAADVVFLACQFIGWPAPSSLLPSCIEYTDAQQQRKRGIELTDGEATPGPETQAPVLLPEAPAERYDEAAPFKGQPCPAPEAPVTSPPTGAIPGTPGALWMLAGEQRECFLLVRNAAASLALGGLTIAVYPQDIVSVTSASLLLEKDATAPTLDLLQQQQQQWQQQQIPGGHAEGVRCTGGIPLRVVSVEPTCSTKRLMSGESDGSSSVRLFSLRPAAPLATSGTVESRAASTKEEELCCLIPPGMTACLRLSVRAAYAGLHRVRFCLRGQPLHQEPQTPETREGGKGSRPPPVWRAVETLLAVAPSLELLVQPRLSWSDPDNILFFCRVRNISTHRLRVAGLGALGIPAVHKKHLQGQQRDGHREVEGRALKSSCFLSGSATEGADVRSVPLVPYRGSAAVDDKNTKHQSSQRVLAPKEDLLLLYAPQDSQALRQLAEATDDHIQVTLRWVLCDDKQDAPNSCISFSSSPDIPYLRDSDCGLRMGTVMPPHPISLAIAPQGLPLELSIASCSALRQRYIEWRADEPCICNITFTVRNISSSLHLKLRMRAESRRVASTMQADDTRDGPAPPTPVEAPTPLERNLNDRDFSFSGESDAGEADRTFDSEDVPPTILPRCVPVLAGDEAEEPYLQHKLIVPDYCYNDGVAARLGSRVIECNNLAFSSAVRSAMTNGDNTSATSRTQRSLSSKTVDDSMPRVPGKDDVSLPTKGLVGQPLHDREMQAHCMPQAQLQQQLNCTASHAALARDTHQQNSLDGWPLGSLEAPPDMPIPTSDGRCLWIGKVAHDIGVLPPGGSAHAEFTALFPCPGIYSLNAMKIYVQLVADNAVDDGIKRREFGSPNRRTGLQRRHRGTATNPVAQLIKSGWPASDAGVYVTFPFDFLVHVVSGDST